MSATNPHPSKVGRFEVLGTAAQGDSGQIFTAVDPTSGNRVRLKAFSKSYLENQGPTALEKFQKEARASATLDHPGILRVLEYGEDAGLAFIVTEDVPETTLKAGLTIPLADAVSLGVQLLEALDYAHDQGVVHRDIEPANLFLTATGQLRIADFGVARFNTGTPEYMSPERLVGLTVGRRSDIFSAGIVFYELLTGVNPFAGPPQEMVDRVCNEKERPPSVANPSVPVSFDEVCAKSLAKVVHDRFPTAFAFSNAIRAAFGAPVSTTVSEATLTAIDPAGSPQADIKPPKSSAATSVSAIHTGIKWDGEILASVQRQLAAFVGPMAKVIVKEAAQRTTDLDRLYQLASESLEKPEERKAFLAQRPGQNKQISQPSRPALSSQPVIPARVSSPAVPVVTPKSVSKLDLKVKPSTPKENTKAPAKADAPAWAAQPDTLEKYFKDEPPQLEEVIHAFVSTVLAVVEVDIADKKVAALSPENICFDRMGKASVRPPQEPAGQGSGVVMALPRFAAPELFAEKSGGPGQTSAAAHVYAVGFMFYQILLGKQLFAKTFPEQRSDLDWLRWHGDMQRKAEPLKALLPSCPDAMSDLVEGMVEKNAEKRIPDSQTVLTKLRAVAQRANRTVILNVRPPRPAAPAAAAAAAPAAAIPSATPVKKDRLGTFIWLFILVVAIGLGFLVWKNHDRLWELIEPYYHRVVPQSRKLESPPTYRLV